MIFPEPDLLYELMGEAIHEAKKAYAYGEVPVGAVLYGDGRILGRGHNLVESQQDATRHAELVAIQSASTNKKQWRLSEAILCVTAEPCMMCAGAVFLSRIPVLVYGAHQPRMGMFGSQLNLASEDFMKHCRVIAGIRQQECAELLSSFFSERRKA